MSQYSQIIPLEFLEEIKNPATLSPGYRGPNCHFQYRSYRERSQEERADYDRLLASIVHCGMQNPIIIYQSYVLIGMRRWEIVMKLRWHKIRVWRIIGEDPGMWLGPDIDRLNILKGKCKEVSY